MVSIVLLSLGLAADAFAVSVSRGTAARNRLWEEALICAIVFGFFQGLMPVIGWVVGERVAVLLADYDHWVAFALLSFIGGKMIFERNAPACEPALRKGLAVLLTLAFATSIDALAAGVGLPALSDTITFPAVIIGVTTFVFSFAGVYLGQQFGMLVRSKAELVGGLVLIGIGVNLVVTHVTA